MTCHRINRMMAHFDALYELCSLVRAFTFLCGMGDGVREMWMYVFLGMVLARAVLVWLIPFVWSIVRISENDF